MKAARNFASEGTDVRTWGTFTDLSISGCYIEMTATFPVGAVVNLGLELNGLHVEVKGEVRVSYPFLGMGVAFREVSHDSQHRMQEMVRSLMPGNAPRNCHCAIESDADRSCQVSLPVIVNPAAASAGSGRLLSKNDSVLTKDDFVRLVRKSQSSAR